MKYKCFCAKDFYDLTRFEVQTMLRGKKLISPKEFMKYYNIDHKQYELMISVKNLKLTREERKVMRGFREKKEIEENKNSKINDITLDFRTANNVPKYFICALYNVDFEIVNGHRYYDVEQFEKAKEDIETKLQQYQDRFLNPQPEKKTYSNLKNIDLVAMRIFRGVDRKRFSMDSGLNLETIKEMESKGAEIPLQIERTYKSVLGITNRHVAQLRDIMKGKSEEITDDRTIPKIIKLKVWKKDNGACSRCSSKTKLHYHHIQRFSEGGLNTVENLTLLCASCHAEEHKGEPAYYMLKSMAER